MTTEATTPPGATLHLGGTAYAHPDLAPALAGLEHEPAGNGTLGQPALTTYPGNPRRGDQDAITASIRDLGLYRAIIVQRSTGHIVAGNHTFRALRALGATRVPVTWVDVDDTRAAAIVARDNRTSELGSYDEAELLALLTTDEDVLALSGYAGEDLAALRATLNPAPDETYTRKADPIHYQPTMETPPPVSSLVDRSKANDLVRRISDTEGLPQEVRDFLVAGAQRHLVFDYTRIAEFYAHAAPEVQDLMERSALVIVDYEDAIQHGFVRVSARLREILDLDLTERAALDAAQGANDGT